MAYTAITLAQLQRFGIDRPRRLLDPSYRTAQRALHCLQLNMHLYPL